MSIEELAPSKKYRDEISPYQQLIFQHLQHIWCFCDMEELGEYVKIYCHMRCININIILPAKIHVHRRMKKKTSVYLYILLLVKQKLSPQVFQ